MCPDLAVVAAAHQEAAAVEAPRAVAAAAEVRLAGVAVRLQAAAAVVVLPWEAGMGGRRVRGGVGARPWVGVGARRALEEPPGGERFRNRGRGRRRRRGRCPW